MDHEQPQEENGEAAGEEIETAEIKGLAASFSEGLEKEIDELLDEMKELIGERGSEGHPGRWKAAQEALQSALGVGYFTNLTQRKIDARFGSGFYSGKFD